MLEVMACRGRQRLPALAGLHAVAFRISLPPGWLSLPPGTTEPPLRLPCLSTSWHAAPGTSNQTVPPILSSPSLSPSTLPQTGAVSQHRLMDRACEFPCVAPSVVGRPHTHMYMVGSRFPGADAWGAPQVRGGGEAALLQCTNSAASGVHSLASNVPACV